MARIECSRCGDNQEYETYVGCKCSTDVAEGDKFIRKTSVLQVIRLWLNEEVRFNGEYYPRRSFASAVQLEDFLSERLK